MIVVMWDICAVGSQKNMDVILVFSAGIFQPRRGLKKTLGHAGVPLGVGNPHWTSGYMGEDPQ